MTDEHFIRQWTDGHERFSADVDRGLVRLRRIIDTAYGELAPSEAYQGNSRGEAMLAGLAATAMTVILLISTVVATPGIVLA
ncbi:MAG TPA: hypothetical protein VL100_03500 [Croceibacterium sp.]|nr:hypothetical protein [Croceibacterium sp.]